MNDYMQYLICYDTPDNKRRRKIVSILEDVCDRVQWSVFEGWLTVRQLESVRSRLRSVIDDSSDNVRIYRLCAYCQAEVETIGQSERTELINYWVV